MNKFLITFGKIILNLIAIVLSAVLAFVIVDKIYPDAELVPALNDMKAFIALYLGLGGLATVLIWN